MLSNLQQFGVNLMMLLLLLIVLLSLLRRRDAPRGLTHRLLLAADLVLVQDAIEIRRHILIGYHLVLKSVSHQQIAGFLVTRLGAVRQRVLLRKDTPDAAVDAQSGSLEDPSLGRLRWQRRQILATRMTRRRRRRRRGSR